MLGNGSSECIVSTINLGIWRSRLRSDGFIEHVTCTGNKHITWQEVLIGNKSCAFINNKIWTFPTWSKVYCMTSMNYFVKGLLDSSFFAFCKITNFVIKVTYLFLFLTKSIVFITSWKMIGHAVLSTTFNSLYSHLSGLGSGSDTFICQNKTIFNV